MRSFPTTKRSLMTGADLMVLTKAKLEGTKKIAYVLDIIMAIDTNIEKNS